MEQALVAQQGSMLARQAANDSQVLDMWLHGRSEHTQRAYRSDALAFLAWVGVGIRRIGLEDVQKYADGLSGKESSRARKLSTVKSLLSFAHRIGYTAFNVGAPVRLPKIKNTLAERILSEEDIMRIIALEQDPRNGVLLRLLYKSGGRVSEICGLTWADAQSRSDGNGQVTLYGKGGKTRAVLLPAEMWSRLQKLRAGASDDAPVFASRKGGGHLDPSQVLRIVRRAAVRAGIHRNVSPHWFRHANASHALDRGCPVQTVQQTLGHTNLATTSRYTHARPNTSSAFYLA